MDFFNMEKTDKNRRQLIQKLSDTTNKYGNQKRKPQPDFFLLCVASAMPPKDELQPIF